MFITIEDETGVANLVVWKKVLEAHRRTVHGAGMMGVRGPVYREEEVFRLVTHRLTDLSRQFASAARRDKAKDAFVEATVPSEEVPPRMPPAKTMAGPHGHVVDEIRLETRDFR